MFILMVYLDYLVVKCIVLFSITFTIRGGLADRYGRGQLVNVHLFRCTPALIFCNKERAVSCRWPYLQLLTNN